MTLFVCVTGRPFVLRFILYTLPVILSRESNAERPWNAISAPSLSSSPYRYTHISTAQHNYHSQQRYRSTVQRIARGSLLLAAMTPHALFLACAVGTKLLLPRTVTWLATETSCLSLLSWWYPVAATITLLHQISQQGSDAAAKGDTDAEKKNTAAAAAETEKENNTPAAKQRGRKQTNTTTPQKSPARQPFFPRTAPGKNANDADTAAAKNKRRRRSSFLPQTPRFHHANPDTQVQEWLQYWMVYAAVQAVSRMLYLLPFFSLILSRYHDFLQSSGLQLQAAFYVWIYVLPHVVIPMSSIGSMNLQLPDTRPLHFLTTYLIQPVISTIHDAISGAVSNNFWQGQVVGKLTTVLDSLVFIRFVSRDTADWLLHVAHLVRAVAVPSTTLLMPGFLTNYGVLYVQYVVPLANSGTAVAASKTATSTTTTTLGNNKKQQQQLLLKYWVLHALTRAILDQCSSILWWIPLSTHFIFLLWCYWNLSVSVETWYSTVQQELQAFGLLPGCEFNVKEWESTRTSRVFSALVARLPSAATNDDNDDENDAAANEKDDAGNAAAPAANVNTTAPATLKDDGNAVPAEPLAQGEGSGFRDDADAVSDDEPEKEEDEYVPDTEDDELDEEEEEYVPKASTPVVVGTRRSTRQRN